MKKLKIGVIGNGHVCEAISLAFSSISETFIYDIDPLRNVDDLNSVNNCDFIFICVPTPMFRDGSQDLSYVERVFNNASKKSIYILGF